MKNHEYSAKSKAKGGKPADAGNVVVGDLIYLKEDGSKFVSRDQYIVTNIVGSFGIIQKIENGKFMSRVYKVPLTQAFKVFPSPAPCSGHDIIDDDSDSDDDFYTSTSNPPQPRGSDKPLPPVQDHSTDSDEDSFTSPLSGCSSNSTTPHALEPSHSDPLNDGGLPDGNGVVPASVRPRRTRQAPDYYGR